MKIKLLLEVLIVAIAILLSAIGLAILLVTPETDSISITLVSTYIYDTTGQFEIDGIKYDEFLVVRDTMKRYTFNNLPEKAKHTVILYVTSGFKEKSATCYNVTKSVTFKISIGDSTFSVECVNWI